MTMPIDLVLVRHGESEGNIANKLSRKGDHSAFTKEFKERHNSQWRLTERGKGQAQKAFFWISDNIRKRFDRYYTSEYLRAMETASLLKFSDAIWYREFYLRERGWGQLDIMSHEEKLVKFGQELKRRERDGFFWAPPGGESLADLCLRIERIFNTLHRECSDKRVIIVCHGEVMWAFRVRIERMTQSRYYELDHSKNPFDRIHNCQILHYTRCDPQTNELNNHMNWFRSVCPSDISLSRNEWEYIERPKNSCEDLFQEVNKVQRIIN